MRRAGREIFFVVADTRTYPSLAGSTLNSGLKHAHWQIRKDAGGHPAAKMSIVL
jgi:hypothetical protein